jgi:hypothetical protein
MKIPFTYPVLIMITVGIGCAGCGQNAPVKKAKPLQQKATLVKPAPIPPKQDTLIFKDPQLSALVQETYKLFSVFDTVNAFSKYEVRKFKFSESQLKDLRNSFDPAAPVTDTIDGPEVTSALSGMIADKLQKILSWKNIDDYDLTLLLKNHIGAIQSPDGKLYNFAFDQKTGGTYHSAISLVHYNPGDGKPSQSFIADESVFNKDGYDSIDTIHTRQGVKYILSGSVVGCTTCIGSYIDMIHFANGKFISDFNYNVGTRTNRDFEDTNDSSIIAYNAKLHTISINYYTNDNAPGCNCGKKGAIPFEEYVGDDSPRPEHVTCLYAFRGNGFVLKKRKVADAKALPN